MKTSLTLLSFLIGAGAMAQAPFSERPLFSPAPPTNFGRTNIFTGTNNSRVFTNPAAAAFTNPAGNVARPGITNGLQGFFPNGQPRFNPDNPTAPFLPGTVPPNAGV